MFNLYYNPILGLVIFFEASSIIDDALGPKTIDQRELRLCVAQKRIAMLPPAEYTSCAWEPP